MEARLPAKIVERRPSTVYRGTVYDQDALVRVDGCEFEVFDPDSVITPDMVGSTRDIQLHVWGCEKTACLQDRSRGAEPVENGRLTVRGRVSNSDCELLDVGVGTVKIEADDLPTDAEKDDFVELRAACAQYLWDVEGSRAYDERYDLFLERLRNDDPEIRAEAAEYLGEKGSEQCLDAMISTLEDDPIPSVRRAATKALGRIGASARKPGEEPDPRIRKSLRTVLEDDSKEVQEAARNALDLVAEWQD